MTKFPRSANHVSLAVQIRSMQEAFPQFRFSKKDNHWLGKLKPTAHSPEYLIKVKYLPYSAPKVEVISPTLHSNCKHLYPDKSLCLYYPDDHPWQGANILARALVIWTAEWLYCYETWRITGEWIGEEAPHSLNKSSS